jgi:hypothetical protein
MAKLVIEYPDEFVLRDGLVLLSGWDADDGGPRLRTQALEGASLWTQAGLLRQALRRADALMDKSWKD